MIRKWPSGMVAYAEEPRTRGARPSNRETGCGWASSASPRDVQQERENELRIQQARLDHDQTIAAMRSAETLQRVKHNEETITLESKVPLVAMREQVAVQERTGQMESKKHEAAMAEIDSRTQALAWDADNKRRSDLALIDQLPEIAKNLAIGEINVPPDMLSIVGQAIGRLFQNKETAKDAA